jgi:hypothetical protein
MYTLCLLLFLSRWQTVPILPDCFSRNQELFARFLGLKFACLDSFVDRFGTQPQRLGYLAQ